MFVQKKSSPNFTGLIMTERFINLPIDSPEPSATNLQVLSTLLQAVEEGGIVVGDKLDDYSIYTGYMGLLWLYLHLHRLRTCISSNKPFLDKAHDLIERVHIPVNIQTNHHVSFMLSPVGYHALCSVIYHYNNDNNKCANHFKALCHHYQENVATVSSELLYGLSGFIYALDFVRSHLGGEHPLLKNYDNLITKAITALFEIGESGAIADWPLMWEWHGKRYLGAAHGVSGILVTLLRHADRLTSKQMATIQQTIRMLLLKPNTDDSSSSSHKKKSISSDDANSLARCESGNWKSSLEMQRDVLVQWCHGAPGFIPLLVKAKHAFASDTAFTLLLEEALDEAALVTAQRGVLRKGLGLCHGVSGNAYALLIAHQETGNPEYLETVLQFASVIKRWTVNLEWRQANFSTPDHPFSLFEGIAGAVAFMAELESDLPVQGFPCMSDL
jgi:lantibiotic modifying enzyme